MIPRPLILIAGWAPSLHCLCLGFVLCQVRCNNRLENLNEVGMSGQTAYKLSRSLRDRDLLLLFIGSVIGSGIFLTPALILRQVGGTVGASLMVWLLGGLFSLFGALTYAELAAANPEAGGLYCYIRDGFGRLPAFLYGWCLFLVIASATIGALAHAFTKYLQEIIPLAPPAGFAGFGADDCRRYRRKHLGHAKKFGFAKRYHADQGGHDCGTGLAASSARLSARPSQSRNHNRYRLVPARLRFGIRNRLRHDLRAMGLRRLAIRNLRRGEVKDPQCSFPRAFFLGSLLLAGLYLFAVVAYLVALGPSAAAKTDTIAAAAATAVLGPWAGKLVAATILISTFSSANSVMLTAPRVYFAMANDKLFFTQLAEIHPRFGTPAAAVLALGVWSN